MNIHKTVTIEGNVHFGKNVLLGLTQSFMGLLKLGITSRFMGMSPLAIPHSIEQGQSFVGLRSVKTQQFESLQRFMLEPKTKPELGKTATS